MSVPINQHARISTGIYSYTRFGLPLISVILGALFYSVKNVTAWSTLYHKWVWCGVRKRKVLLNSAYNRALNEPHDFFSYRWTRNVSCLTRPRRKPPRSGDLNNPTRCPTPPWLAQWTCIGFPFKVSPRPTSTWCPCIDGNNHLTLHVVTLHPTWNPWDSPTKLLRSLCKSVNTRWSIHYN